MNSNNLDIVVVGAGISGINAAVRLQQLCPTQTFTILESKQSLGGTWDTFRYPGVRSDVDMWTYSFSFNPWNRDRNFGSGRMILDYLKDTAKKFHVEQYIQYQHQVISANWNSQLHHWELLVDTPIGTKNICCRFLLLCSGFYNHKQGYLPEFKNINEYQGKFFHSQQWPTDLHIENKKIIVIGSGATATGLVPVLANYAKHVTMLQRSPSYFLNIPDIEPQILKIRKRLPKTLSYFLLRWRNIFNMWKSIKTSLKNPELAKYFLLGNLTYYFSKNEIEKNFTPKYLPWQQRICVSPNAEFFKSIQSRKASVVTGEIDQFTESGIQLTDGQHLEADIVVAATGVQLQPLGNIKLSIDNIDIDLSQTISYRGMMLSNIPNLAYIQGYFANSWMLRSDMTIKYLCRKVFKRLQKRHYCLPVLDTNIDRTHHLSDWNNTSNYWARARSKFYQFGTKQPWVDTQDYYRDWILFNLGHYFDRTLKFV